MLLIIMYQYAYGDTYMKSYPVYLMIFSCVALASTTYLTDEVFEDVVVVTAVPSDCTTVLVIEPPDLTVLASAMPWAV